MTPSDVRRTLLALGAAVVLTGCSASGEEVMCTKVGMQSGVTVVWRAADFGDKDAANIRVCVDGTCEERASGGDEDLPVQRLEVRLPDDIGAATVPVRLTVTAAGDGHVIVEDSRRVRLTEQHPNGPSCPPTAWTATLRAHPVEGLTSTEGLSLRTR